MAGPYDALLQQYVTPGGGDPFAPPEEEPSWIRSLANSSIFAPLKWIGESLGKPQQALYGLLDGDVSALANLIPFSDTLGITGHEPGQGLINTPHRTGQDMLRKWGVIDSGDSWGNWGAGLAMDLLADPLAFASFGKGALTAAGKAAEKSGTLERTLLGRATAGQGGLVNFHAPWYATLTGLADKTPWATIGTDGPGAIGKGIGQWVGQKSQDLGEAATRWTVPGTNWSPVAAFQSTFQPFRGITGNPEVNLTAGRQLEADTLARSAAARGAQMPFALQQADALNALAKTGMATQDAGDLLWRAGISKSEVGDALLQPNLTAAQRQIALDFADAAAASRGTIDTQADLFRQTGGAVRDTSSPWQAYEPLQGADYANRLRGHMMERSDLGKYLGYGSARLDEFARDPNLAGFAALKQAGVPVDQAAITASKAAAAAHIAQTNANDIQSLYGHLLGPGGVPVGPLAPEMAELLKHADPTYGLKSAEKIADYLASRPAGPLYNPDLASSRIAYGQNFAKLGAGNLTALQTIANQAKPLQSALTAATDTRSVTDVTSALKTAGLADSAIPELQSRLAALGKQAPLNDLGISSDLAEILKKELQGPKSTPPGAFSKLASWFRYGVTVPFPANLTRNWADTLLQEGLSGSSATKNLGTAGDYFRKAITDPAKLAKAQSAFEAGFQHGLFDDQLRAFTGGVGLKEGHGPLNIAPAQAAKSRLTSLAEQFSPVKDALVGPRGQPGGRVATTGSLDELRQLAEKAGLPFDPAAVASKPAVPPSGSWLGDRVAGPVKEYLKAMEGSHQFQNNVTRLQQMMNLLDEGFSPAAAAERVKISQLDYNRLSPTMRESGRAVVPFANFSLQNLRRTADLLQQDPGRLGALMTLANSGRSQGDFVPSYVSGGAAIPLAGAEEGKQRFLSSFGIPMEDEAIGSIAAMLSGRPFEAMRRFGSSVNPALKVPAEIATGTQVFSGRPLADLKPSGTLASLIGDNPFSRGLSEVVQGTPGARVISTSDRLLDSPSKGILASLLNLGTGVRVTDVDRKMASEIAARDAVRELLKQSGQFKSRESVYLDRSKVADLNQLPPDLQELLAQYQAIEKRSQAAAKTRAQAKMVP